MTNTDVAFVLGTRPEIIKTAPVIKESQRRGLDTRVVHTGQHYSDSLNLVFFEQLNLSPPEVNLGVGSDSHGSQTGAMLDGIEEELTEHEPSVVFVQGDTNSTLAGALAGSKLDTDVAHIEAGLRSFDREMPEETNRVIVDHIADYLFPPTDASADHLRDEGLSNDQISVTGNTIVDAVHAYSDAAANTTNTIAELGLEDEFALVTAHRAETVDSKETFSSVLNGVGQALEEIGIEAIYPIHPRAANRLEEFSLTVPESITTIEPLGFLEFLRLEEQASIAFTDSGGVQEEACILGTPCVTFRYGTERPETVFVGANCIAGHEPADIIAAGTRMYEKTGNWEIPFGDGNAASHIIDSISL